MKKILAIFIAVCLLCCFAACSPSEEEPKEKEKENKKVEIEDGETFKYEGIKIVIPDDYEKDLADGITIFYTDSFPDKTDNITFGCENGKNSLSDYSKSNLEDEFEGAYGAMDAAVEYEITDHKETKIDGYDTVKCIIEVSVDEIEMKQTAYIILLDKKTVTITFTDISGEYTKEFKNIAETIEVYDGKSKAEGTKNEEEPTATVEPTPTIAPTPTLAPTPVATPVATKAPALSFTSKEYVCGNVKIDIPQNFNEQSLNGTSIIYTDSYPTCTDNIVVTYAAVKDNIDRYTKEDFESIYKQSYESQNIQANFEITQYEKIKLNGQDVIYCEISCEANGVKMIQKQYNMFLENATASLTFTMVTDQYASIFNEIASTFSAK